MNEYQITTHVDPPISRMGRPKKKIWIKFNESLKRAREISGGDWAAIGLPKNGSIIYALRLARAAGLEAKRGDTNQSIKVKFNKE